MDLKQVRILEFCHKFLIGITDFEEEFQDDHLVYQYNGDNISFETYQESERLSFIDYNLRQGYLDDARVSIDERQDLIDVFPTEEHLRVLTRIKDADQARIQIFKLLSQVNLETLSEKNPNIKRDNFGYGFFNHATKEEYPIYLFQEGDVFELVAIG
ncbi:hypothetical protein [Streptococcus orisratti]|uniref:hypothetical protein n=1 Tax=Streptococcus orisratti TaxID=114652 RepID=UPI003D075E38